MIVLLIVSLFCRYWKRIKPIIRNTENTVGVLAVVSAYSSPGLHYSLNVVSILHVSGKFSLGSLTERRRSISTAAV